MTTLRDDLTVRRLVALGAPFGALVLELLLWPLVAPSIWFFFFPCVFVSAWLGGRRVGLIATTTSTILVWWFFLRHVPIEPRHMLQVGVFFATGAAFSLFNERLKNTITAHAAERQLEVDLRGMTKLEEIASLRITENALEPVFAKIVDATIESAGADGATIGVARIAVHHGVDDGFEVELPVVDRDGKSIGALTACYARERRPNRHDRRMLDLLARQAADVAQLWETNRRLERVSDERRIFAALVENCSDFIGIADPHGTPIYLNPAGRQMVGIADDTPVERTTIADYYPPSEREFAREVIVKSMLERGHWEGETFFRNWKTEEPIPVSDKHFVVRVPETGEILGMATITREISEEKSLERALIDAREFLENVLESSTEYSIIAKDLDRRIVGWNKGAELIYGYKPSEVLGRSSEILHAVEDVESGLVKRMHERALAEGRATGLFRRVRKDRTEFLARVTITRRNDPSGKPIGYLIVSHDVTLEQKHVAEQKFLADVGEALQTSLDYSTTLDRIARLVVSSLGDCCAIDVIDEAGDVRRRKVLHADPAMAPLVAELEKVAPERDLGHPLWEAFDTKQPTIVTNVTPDMLAMHVHDERHRTLLAKIGVVSVIVVPLVARGRLLALVTIASTRAEHHYSRDDFRLVLDLARRASLALDNARLYEVAQMAIQARDQVLSVVAHDLRNPLGNILMQVKSACDERGADVIRRAVTRMNRLIQDLLDATRIDARRFSVTPARVATNDMLAECVEAQRPLAASASLELRIDAAADLPDIWADRDQLLRVFENLIGNAIKFTDAGGCITVRASPRDADVLFAVADTGHGLAAKDLPHVFDRFWQASANERRGAGLGLPIVKGIVEAHGGRIWVDSEEGHGTTFSFTIPH